MERFKEILNTIGSKLGLIDDYFLSFGAYVQWSIMFGLGYFEGKTGIVTGFLSGLFGLFS